MPEQAKGSFDITSTARPPLSLGDGVSIGHMTFSKTFTGDLQGGSVVEMLGLMNPQIGSGAYVALERVTGALGERRGSFCLQHSSSMARGRPSQHITVVPDSGTGGLTGLVGTFTIDIVDGKHFYTFDYGFEGGG